MWDMTFYDQNYQNCEGRVKTASDIEMVYSPILTARRAMQVNDKLEDMG